MYLETIAQKSEETLESYLTRFKEVVNKVGSVNETKALVHLRRGLDPYDCERYICKLMEHKPTTLAKAYELASYFITETEAMRVMKQTRNPLRHFQPQKDIFSERTLHFPTRKGRRGATPSSPNYSRASPG